LRQDDQRRIVVADDEVEVVLARRDVEVLVRLDRTVETDREVEVERVLVARIEDTKREVVPPRADATRVRAHDLSGSARGVHLERVGTSSISGEELGRSG